MAWDLDTRESILYFKTDKEDVGLWLRLKPNRAWAWRTENGMCEANAGKANYTYSRRSNQSYSGQLQDENEGTLRRLSACFQQKGRSIAHAEFTSSVHLLDHTLLADCLIQAGCCLLHYILTNSARTKLTRMRRASQQAFSQTVGCQ